MESKTISKSQVHRTRNFFVREQSQKQKQHLEINIYTTNLSVTTNPSAPAFPRNSSR